MDTYGIVKTLKGSIDNRRNKASKYIKGYKFNIYDVCSTTIES